MISLKKIIDSEFSFFKALPALLWQILFLWIPLLFIFIISFLNYNEISINYISLESYVQVFNLTHFRIILRSLLLDAYGSSNISIFQPSYVKKTAGKGNANKHYMIKAFQDDVFNDKDLRNTKLWKYVQGKDFSTKIPKPLDDLVDSYFILNSQTTSN